MTRNKILVAGEVGSVLPVKLIHAILDASGQSDKAKTADATDLEENGGLVIPWNVSTKYYSARLDFWLLPGGIWDPAEAAEDIASRKSTDGPDEAAEFGQLSGSGQSDSGVYGGDWDAIGTAIDAIALVIDRNQAPAPEFLASWGAFAERFGPAIQICVGFNETPEEDNDCHTVHEWCIENGFEYVRISRSNGGMDEQMDKQTRERIGVARVIEALESHTWDSLVGGDSGEDDSALFSFATDASAMDTTKLFPSGDEVNAMHHSIFDGIDDEDGFEATIERLQKLRGIAESLPDAERHSLAAQVGLAFLKQFDADVRVNANGQESMDKDLQM